MFETLYLFLLTQVHRHRRQTNPK